MKKWLWLLFWVVSANGQVVSLRDEITIKADRLAGADSFGWYYLIRDNVLVKTDGKTTTEFQDVRLGKVSRVDLRNPLLIVLFYESFNTIVLLDNQMNEVYRVDFNNRATPIVVKAAGFASRNMLWLYDNLQQQLYLYDYQADKLQGIGTPFRAAPTYYDTSFNYFIWIDPSRQAYQIDIFGKVSLLGEMPIAQHIRHLSDTRWIIASTGKIDLYNSANKEFRELLDVGNSLKNFYYHDQILSIFTGHGIKNFNFKSP